MPTIDATKSEDHLEREMPKSLLSMATIGGRTHDTDERFEVINPATGAAFSTAPLCGAPELTAAVTFCKRAQPQWAQSERNRRGALLACSHAIARKQEDLAKLITLEQGKPIAEARSEVAYAAEVFAAYSEMEVPSKDLSNGETSRTLLFNRPYGIVGLITPWNFPIGTAAVKLAPALLAGNAVILKPSPIAPLSPLLLGRILKDLLPAGILNTLSGDKSLGEQITRHPDIRKLSVTGSIPTGQAILSEAAVELKSVTLELGGNDPAILLPDCDPHEIAGQLLDSAWRNAGQVCSAIKRIYVHQSRHSELIAALSKLTPNYKVGSGMESGVRIGPLTTEYSRERLTELLQSAIAEGAKVTKDSRPLPSHGYFFSPAIVSEIRADHPLVLEEQFGPILPVVPYRNIDEAIEWSNATNYGLSASVWTKCPSVGYEIASKLECGRVGVNGHRRAKAAAPFGGFKHSGLGRELGSWGLAEMCESQVVNIFE
ncbi:aldehyde dehydrogenase family protein [Pelagicoccus enzymogenes]|uniref:aldehyde dehydrogenase family protein n=1 Tax=Pelagicoccus enzymogenes TaxID=2773457 RepID=UPI0028110449|nr:aldehyde dehydrogenase family protein [Pelagicoccus enzymogenes]